MLVTVRPLDVVEGPAKLFDLGAEPIGFGPELLALGPEPVALAAEGLDVLGLLLCLLELLLEAGMLVTVRPFDVVEACGEAPRPGSGADRLRPGVARARPGAGRPRRGGPRRPGTALAVCSSCCSRRVSSSRCASLGVIEGPAEVVALRAELIAIGPEATGLVSHRLLALGECRPQPLSLVQRVLSVDAQTMLVGAGRLEPFIALFEQPGEPVDLGEGGVEIRVPPFEFAQPRDRVPTARRARAGFHLRAVRPRTSAMPVPPPGIVPPRA